MPISSLTFYKPGQPTPEVVLTYWFTLHSPGTLAWSISKHASYGKGVFLSPSE